MSTTSSTTTMSTTSTEEKIAVMQAFVDGKDIRVTGITHPTTELRNNKQGRELVWDWSRCTYTVFTPWYENIPEGGVLCWVQDSSNGDGYLEIIHEYEDGNGHPYIATARSPWKFATPLTRAEIQVYIDNLPK